MSLPDLLFLHGALGSRSQFSSLLPLLEEHFQLHTLDFEGHGTAPLKDRPFRLTNFAENVIEYLDQNSLKRIDIFGYSMGGAVGPVLAKNIPERIDRVHTLAMKMDWAPEVAEREMTLLNPDTILKKVPKFAALLKERHIASGWRNVLEKTKEMFLHLGAEGFLSEEEIRQISRKVRVGVGDRDNMVGIEETLSVYRLLPQGELQVFPSTPHPLEKASIPDLMHSIRFFFR